MYLAAYKLKEYLNRISSDLSCSAVTNEFNFLKETGNVP